MPRVEVTQLKPPAVVPAENYILSISAYSVLFILYSADVRAEGTLNSLPSAIRGRWAKAI